MELPVYFDFKKFERNYLIDFKDMRSKNPSLHILDYYKQISDTYFKIHADLNKINFTNNDLIDYLFELYNTHKDFLHCLNDLFFDTFMEKFKERKRKDKYFTSSELVKEIIIENTEIIGSTIDYVVQEIQDFILNETYKIEFHSQDKKVSKGKTYTNPQKLALLQELGFFELPIFKGLTETRVNEITGLLLGADPKEFVYKNRLNLKSRDPDYQTDKYTAYQYLEEMKRLIYTTD